MAKPEHRLRMFFLTLVVMMSAGICASCGDDPNGPAKDSVAPTIISTSPENDAEQVDPGITISATFSERLDSSTVSAASFTLDDTIPGTVSYADSTATFVPDQPLDSGVLYTAKITTAVSDRSGNTMTSDYSWTFQTAGSWLRIITDPDEPWDRDIAKVWARCTDSTLEFKVETNGDWGFWGSETEGIDVAFYLDVDQNRATGDTATLIGDSTHLIGDIGAEYKIIIGNHGNILERWLDAGPFSGWLLVHEADGFPWGVLENDTNVFELGIYRSNIGSPTGKIDIVTANVLLPSTADWAPDQGHAVFDFATCQPSAVVKPR
ncbi:MAG: Ig-like domain-containing protein [Candidatus Zixiibacteriota bacterium]|nr:MAG: Ig-like domain-containing protein [candidate division Zixibacteria bacterium]